MVPYKFIDLAIRQYHKDYLVIFGNAAEICIREHYDKRDDNYSGYGSSNQTYQLPNGVRGEAAKKYFAGSEYFRLTELEVWSVHFV